MMKALILLPMLASCALSQYLYPVYTHHYPYTQTYAYSTVPQHGSYKYHNQDSTGQYNYGYSTPLHSQSEAKDASGNVVGNYKYVTPDNQVVQVRYSAGSQGFKVHGNAPEAIGFRAKRQIPADTYKIVSPQVVVPVHHLPVVYHSISADSKDYTQPKSSQSIHHQSAYHHQQPAGFAYGYSTYSQNK